MTSAKQAVADGALALRSEDRRLPARQAARAASLAAAAVVCAWATASPAAAFDLGDSGWEGCSELLAVAKSELGESRVVVRAVLDWSTIQPGDGVMLVHPQSALDAEEATAFMRAGGRLAIVDDYGRGDALLEHFRIERRALPSRPENALRQKPALPIAVPASQGDGGPLVGLHPTVVDVDAVVLNHGTGFVHPDLTPVLLVHGIGEGEVAVAVAGQVDAGRLFALGDSSAFINLMMRYPGNRRFASGLIEYLVASDAAGSPGGRLFIVANRFDERGGFGGVTPWRKTVDRTIRNAIDALSELRRSGVPAWLRPILAAVIALLAGWWGWRALGSSYRARMPRFARATPMLAQGGAAGRVAVLAARSSTPALALLELRNALLESVGGQLGAPEGARPAALLAELERRGTLEPPTRAALKEVLGKMQRAEQAVLTGVGVGLRHRDVVRAADVVRDVLAETSASASESGAPRPTEAR